MTDHADHPQPSLTRLIKLMKMTTSAHDGEALAAMRLANKELAKFGQDWGGLLSGKITVIGDPFATMAAPRPEDVRRTNAPPPPRPASPPPPPRPTSPLRQYSAAPKNTPSPRPSAHKPTPTKADKTTLDYWQKKAKATAARAATGKDSNLGDLA